MYMYDVQMSFAYICIRNAELRIKLLYRDDSRLIDIWMFEPFESVHIIQHIMASKMIWTDKF